MQVFSKIRWKHKCMNHLNIRREMRLHTNQRIQVLPETATDALSLICGLYTNSQTSLTLPRLPICHRALWTSLQNASDNGFLYSQPRLDSTGRQISYLASSTPKRNLRIAQYNHCKFSSFKLPLSCPTYINKNINSSLFSTILSFWPKLLSYLLYAQLSTFTLQSGQSLNSHLCFRSRCRTVQKPLPISTAARPTHPSNISISFGKSLQGSTTSFSS